MPNPAQPPRRFGLRHQPHRGRLALIVFAVVLVLAIGICVALVAPVDAPPFDPAPSP